MGDEFIHTLIGFVIVYWIMYIFLCANAYLSKHNDISIETALSNAKRL